MEILFQEESNVTPLYHKDIDFIIVSLGFNDT